MLLVIPAIDLLDEHCVRRAGDAFVREARYFDDPVKMARLWRLQNARTLHVVGHDHGDQCRRAILKSVCDAVDIPVQVAGGFHSAEDIDSAFAAGVYRIVMEIESDEDAAFFAENVARYGNSRVVACLHAREGMLAARPDVSAGALAAHLEEVGCRRLVYSDTNPAGYMLAPNFDAVATIADGLHRSRLTVSGGISGYDDLMRVSDLREYGVDSVVIGRALYENRFPCQQFWCWNYMDDLDLSRFTTARMADS
jgi:phosphoribosylformimino-5-aminoimidazole carboxamide ribotide isomerase